jgi:hypothetical protein
MVVFRRSLDGMDSSASIYDAESVPSGRGGNPEEISLRDRGGRPGIVRSAPARFAVQSYPHHYPSKTRVDAVSPRGYNALAYPKED